MDRIVLFLLLIPMMLTAIDQDFLVRNNGEKIAYQKMKLKKGSIIVTGTNKKKLVLDPEEIKGRFSLKTSKMEHMKSTTDPLGNKSHQFIERVMEGKIKVYEKTISTYTYNPYGGVTTSNTYLYLEKGDEYFNVLTTNTIGQNKKDKLSKLKSLVEDDPEALRLLNESSYKHKIRNIKSVVDGYNLRAHQPTSSEEGAVGKILFFRGEERQSEETFELSVGGADYSLELNDSISVNIPTMAETKVCVSNGSEEFCKLIVGSEYFDQYYEIAMGKDDEVLLELKDREYAENVLKRLELYRYRRERE